MKPVDPTYLAETFTIRPRDRLHRLVARLHDTWIDDLSEERIEEVERLVDSFRHTHASGKGFDMPLSEAELIGRDL
jgi:hypothetical protein